MHSKYRERIEFQKWKIKKKHYCRILSKTIQYPVSVFSGEIHKKMNDLIAKL